MSDIIQLLPDSVANQIAAGEVIQRPASVIKELVENAVDAGATKIDISVVDAGRTVIQVIDNGKGMSETDARLSFERHATSKIRKADDLFALHTMGFRGEALASIAAVAQVELRTRTADEQVGTLVSVSASKVVSQEPCSCPVGANFKVENLFFNVPARRKFLKSNATEMNNVLTSFERIALVYPEINFSVRSNNAEIFNLRSASLRQRIVDIFGKRIDQDIIPLSVDTTLCRIKGFVGKPESSRKKGCHQYFFVNGRYMKHPYFHKAVLNAYGRMIPEGEQIPYFIYMEVEAESIDVNIHPTKTEIKFENEQAIWQILTAAVRDALGKFCEVPSIEFDNEGAPAIPVFTPGESHDIPKVKYDPQYNPFSQQTPYHKERVPSSWESLFGDLTPSGKDDTQPDLFSAGDGADAAVSPQTSDDIIAEKSPSHYQYKGKYIITAVKSGLMIIDQHRAHVRILFDRYLSQQGEKTISSQRVLFPEVVQFPPSDVVVLQKILPEMEDMGFELTDLGGGSYAINGVPADTDGLDYVALVKDMVESVVDKDVTLKDGISRSLALSLARRAAIPVGQMMSNDEMDSLVNDLFASSNVNYTPDGKSILCILPQNEIENMLG